MSNVICEVCGNQHLTRAFSLGLHPLCDALQPVSDGPATAELYPINILFCDVCKTAHQEHQVPKETLFPRSYHYRSNLTQDVVKGTANLLSETLSLLQFDDRDVSILDVGCNDGTLLDSARTYFDNTYGIEPTDAALDAQAKLHSVIQAYLTPQISKQFVTQYCYPDVITFTNVFAHIEDFDQLMSSLSILLSSGTSQYLVIENHYLGSILASSQFDTFYHEHPRTYSATSFVHIAKRLGLVIMCINFPSRYGGNIRVTMGKQGCTPIDPAELKTILISEEMFGARLANLEHLLEVWRSNKSSELRKLVSLHGPLRAKAFPGRAALLLQILNADSSIFSQVYEKSSSPKVGNFIPGTDIPIVSDDSFDIYDTSPIVNLAWHIKSEISEYMRDLGFHGQIINIVDQTDV